MNLKEQEKLKSLIAYLECLYIKLQNSQPIFGEKSKKHNDTIWKNTRLLVSNDDLSKYYNEVKRLNWLVSGVDFNVFSNLICRNPSSHFSAKSKYYPFYDCHKVYFREKLGFVKNQSELKNKKNDSAKSDWRTHKKIKKDKSKKHFNRGLNSKIKRDTHQAYRANIKRLVKAEKFDEIFVEKEKWYLDPWDWD